MSVYRVAIIAGVLTAVAAFFASAMTSKQSAKTLEAGSYETAIFAGGCFWCVESDFDKVDGVLETVSGYIGGRSANPTYRNHGTFGHYEAVRVAYDPEQTDYQTLVSYFFRHIDPTDDGGQFCDRGDSYRTAVFVETPDERAIVEAEIAAIDASNILPGSVVTEVIDSPEFWPAEAYHQDYYLKNSVKYGLYRNGCGRDDRVKEVWSGDARG